MDWRTLVSGMTAGGVSTILLHPIDLVKVRMQTDTSVTSGGSSGGGGGQFVRTFRMLRNLQTLYGSRALYQGLSANIIGATSSWGLYFMLYDWLKKQAITGNSYFGSAALSGAIVQVVTNPVWTIKTRLCNQDPSSAQKYRSLLDCMARIVRKDGVRGLYRGLLPGLVGVSHGAVQFTIYEHLKQILAPQLRDHHILLYLLSSSTSKIIALSVTYPYQVFRARLQVSDTTIRALLRDFIKREGALGVYKGLGPSILRVLPATCITFMTYEAMSSFLRQVN